MFLRHTVSDPILEIMTMAGKKDTKKVRLERFGDKGDSYKDTFQIVDLGGVKNKKSGGDTKKK